MNKIIFIFERSKNGHAELRVVSGYSGDLLQKWCYKSQILSKMPALFTELLNSPLSRSMLKNKQEIQQLLANSRWQLPNFLFCKKVLVFGNPKLLTFFKNSSITIF